MELEYIENHRNLFISEREYRKNKVIFYRDLLNKISLEEKNNKKNQEIKALKDKGAEIKPEKKEIGAENPIILSVSINKMLEFEFGKVNNSDHLAFVDAITSKLANQVIEIEKSKARETSVVRFLYEIANLRSTNPDNMRSTLMNYCAEYGLDFERFNQRLNKDKINAIQTTIWASNFSGIETSQVEKMNTLEFENDQLKLFEDTLKEEKAKLKYQIEISEDFKSGTRKDKNNSPDTVCDYNCYYDILFSIYSNIVDKVDDQTIVFTPEQVALIREDSVKHYINLAVKTFNDNVDNTLEQIDSNREVKKLFLKN